MNPKISVIIPVYNEEACIDMLFKRLVRIMDKQGHAYEIIFVDDGSTDATSEHLKKCYQSHPDKVVLLEFSQNYGQNIAITAGFEKMRGNIAITLDADMQTPPEEIPTVLSALSEDRDYIGSYRKKREDNALRRWVSKLSNLTRKKLTNIQVRDQGCMLRVYRKSLVDRILNCNEPNIYISLLAQSLSQNSTEVPIDHQPRQAGETSYNYTKLLRLHFDIITSFSVVPLQYVTYTGIILTLLSSTFFLIALFRSLSGFTLEMNQMLIHFLSISISLGILGLGIVGEYLGRLYRITQNRPRYILRSDVLKK